MIDEVNGIFKKLIVSRYSDGERLSFEVQLKKGLYIDDGVYFLRMPELEVEEW